MTWLTIRSRSADLAWLRAEEEDEEGGKLQPRPSRKRGSGLALMTQGINFVTASISALDLGFALPPTLSNVLESQSSVFNAGTSFPALSCAVNQRGGSPSDVFPTSLTL